MLRASSIYWCSDLLAKKLAVLDGLENGASAAPAAAVRDALAGGGVELDGVLGEEARGMGGAVEAFGRPTQLVLSHRHLQILQVGGDLLFLVAVTLGDSARSAQLCEWLPHHEAPGVDGADQSRDESDEAHASWMRRSILLSRTDVRFPPRLSLGLMTRRK